MSWSCSLSCLESIFLVVVLTKFNGTSRSGVSYMTVPAAESEEQVKIGLWVTRVTRVLE